MVGYMVNVNQGMAIYKDKRDLLLYKDNMCLEDDISKI